MYSFDVSHGSEETCGGNQFGSCLAYISMFHGPTLQFKSVNHKKVIAKHIIYSTR